MKYIPSLKISCCLFICLFWVVWPFETFAAPSGKILLLEIDLDAAGSYDGVTASYNFFVDDLQKKFDSDFNYQLDYEKVLDANSIKELKIDFYKLKSDFYNRREMRLSAYDFKDYDYVVGFEIVYYSELGLIVYDVAKQRIIEKKRSIEPTWKSELEKRDLISLTSAFSPELIKIKTAEADAKDMAGSVAYIDATQKTPKQLKKTSDSLPEISSTLLPSIPKQDFHFSASNIVNDDSIAVIIGNRNYQKGTPSVKYAHNDSDLIRRYLIEGLGYREGNIIYIKDATQADMISTFGNERSHKAKLFNWLRPNESDVFIYYSGHGAPSLSSGQGFLLPVDGDPSTIEFNGYPLQTLYSNLGKLSAKSLTVVIDACFSGSSQAGSVVKNASAISLKRVDTKISLPNATVLTAAAISEVASWDEDAKLGLFTRHFIEGVTGKADQDKFGNGDGQVTLGEMKTYLEREVTYMARRLYNRDQHPQVTGEADKVLSGTK